MSCIICTLLLVAVMASSAGPDVGPPIQCGVTCFVCVNCSKTCHLSNRWLFLNQAGVCRHINASKACFAAGLCICDIHVNARAGDVLARPGGAAGPAPDVRQLRPGTQNTDTITLPCITCTLLANWLRQLARMHKVIGLNPGIIKILLFREQPVHTCLDL